MENNNLCYEYCKIWDYIIVGAGISGAVVLEKLVEKYGNTKNILILERHNEIGGCLNTFSRNYGNTTYTNNELRRPCELGGMRYFTEMKSIVEYINKYHLKSKDVEITSNKNILLINNKIEKIVDQEYFNLIDDEIISYLDKMLEIKDINLAINNYSERKQIFNNILSSNNIQSMYTQNIIENSTFNSYIRNNKYNGFIDNDIAASMSIEILDLDKGGQRILVDGFQNMVQVIFDKNGINTINNKTKKKIIMKLNTNVCMVNDNILKTNNGNYKGKKIIWTIPPKFMADIGTKSKMHSKILDEYINGFWDFRATKIFLLYDKPWWDSSLIGRNLSDTTLGQLWVWDDKTLLIYCCDQSAIYWQNIIGISPNLNYGKYIDIQENITTIPGWYSDQALTNISKLFPIENITPLTGYAIAFWNNNVPVWKTRDFKKYGNILKRRNRIRFPFCNKQHIYMSNGSSLYQGWVDGSIEEVINVFKEINI